MKYLLLLLVSLPILASTACVSRPAFQCADDDACGAGATCQPSGFCSVDDSGCDSGQRYHESAGDDLAGSCVALPDAGVAVDAPDLPSVDAPPPGSADASQGASDATAPDAGTVACSHSVCLEGPPLESNCSCATAVCAVDSYCCRRAWDLTCIKRAETLCASPAPRCSEFLAVAGGTQVAQQVSRVFKYTSPTEMTPVWDTGTDTRNHSIPAWADIDGDGDADLALGSIFGSGDPSNYAHLYRNGGGDSFYSVGSLAAGDNCTSVAWADADGDGDMDLAVGNYGRPSIILRNDGTGALSTYVTFPSANNASTQSIQWVDYDDDGHMDVHLSNMSDTANYLYRNLGDGRFQLVTAFSDTMRDESNWITAWADFDNDGDRDVMVGAMDGSADRLYMNDGSGSFSEIWNDSYLDGRTFGIAWGDVDGDGLLDVALSYEGQADRILRNTGMAGQARFELYWTSPDTFDSWSAAFGDYDGDGDLDLAIADLDATAHIYRNMGAQPTPGDRFVRIWSASQTIFGAGVAFGPDLPATTPGGDAGVP